MVLEVNSVRLRLLIVVNVFEVEIEVEAKGGAIMVEAVEDDVEVAEEAEIVKVWLGPAFGTLELPPLDEESDSDRSLKKSAFCFPKLAPLLPQILGGGDGEDSGESGENEAIEDSRILFFFSRYKNNTGNSSRNFASTVSKVQLWSNSIPSSSMTVLNAYYIRNYSSIPRESMFNIFVSCCNVIQGIAILWTTLNLCESGSKDIFWW
ncbi:hypothetical protein BDZ94DRAFT_1239438 [Collybia nuda]|uniref:Uncharacterized protein n=1 Tax=Collybia nuda TaxID=64659 RepID=A0A9P5XWS1_9AGAR|nr:hypothetical protein BDZ94DRAFT_1239438 [Collybia nuda]